MNHPYWSIQMSGLKQAPSRPRSNARIPIYAKLKMISEIQNRKLSKHNLLNCHLPSKQQPWQNFEKLSDQVIAYARGYVLAENQSFAYKPTRKKGGKAKLMHIYFLLSRNKDSDMLITILIANVFLETLINY